MSTSETIPPNLNSAFCELAEVRIVSQRGWPLSNYWLAYVLVSSRIYCKATNSDGSDKPQSLIDFRNVDSLELDRLNEGTLSDVKKIVEVDSYKGRPRISVPGLLFGPRRRRSLFLLRNVRLEIVAYQSAHHEVWLNQIHARIVPWKLLPQLLQSYHYDELTWWLMDEVDERSTGNPAMVLDRMLQKLTIVDELTAHGGGAVETGATLVKLVASLERVAESAERAADATKCAAGISTIFHLVGLTTQSALMCAEAKRGRRVLPVRLRGILILLRYVLKSIMQIGKPSGNVNEVDDEFKFGVLEQVVSTLDMAETQLLRGWCGQFMNAEDVKRVEWKISDLRHMVVTVRCMANGELCRKEVRLLREDVQLLREEVQHDSPSFAGCTRRFDTRRSIFRKPRSAVIEREAELEIKSSARNDTPSNVGSDRLSICRIRLCLAIPSFVCLCVYLVYCLLSKGP